MCEIKWIKIWTKMFDTQKMKIIEDMNERDTIECIWFKLLVEAGKTNYNGYIFMDEDIPYTTKMLASVLNRPIKTIKHALKILMKFKMIDVDDENYIRILNWDSYQNVEEMDQVKEQTRKRVAAYRKRKRDIKTEEIESKEIEAEEIDEEDNSINDNEKVLEEEQENTCNVTLDECNVTVTQQNKKKKKNKEIDKDIEKNNKKENIEEDFFDGGTELNINQSAMTILMHYEKLLGRIGVFQLSAIESVVERYGEKQVCRAIDKAIEADVINMKYVNGILNNWSVKGYEGKGNTNFDGRNLLSNRTDFKGYKAKKPRKLTEEERKASEALLL